MPPSVTRARNAVAAVFVLNGVCFASLVSRLPDLREALRLDNSALGLLLLAIAGGSILAMPSAGRIIERSSASVVVRLGAVLVATGLATGMLGAALGSTAATALGLFTHGAGSGLWDVAMNVEGAAVERRLGRTVMPRFHAAWSVGSIAGAGVGIPMAALHTPLLLHVGTVATVALGATWWVTTAFLTPVVARPERGTAAAPVMSAWREPRTLAIGVMVLSFALVEGTANDWLSLALIDGYEVRHWVGVTGFAVFVCAMTLGRLLGPVLLDRFGRVPLLWSCAAATAVGILLVVFGGSVPLVGAGVLVWGLGASLGFPVGISAAADDPDRSAARVSVVSTIGYGAFFVGPPALGWLADHVGTLDALLAIALLMVPAGLTAFAARPVRPGGVRAGPAVE